jgi:hypothetical protein
MVLIAFKSGKKAGGLAHINHKPVPLACHQAADKLRKTLFPELQAGKVIVNLTPLRLVDTEQNCYTRPESDLVDASLSVNYIAPLEKQQRLAVKVRVREPSLSVGAMCAEICAESTERVAQYNVSEIFTLFDDFRRELGGLPSDHRGLRRRVQQEANRLLDSETDSDNPVGSGDME